jgi:hypothetical protein
VKLVGRELSNLRIGVIRSAMRPESELPQIDHV